MKRLIKYVHRFEYLIKPKIVFSLDLKCLFHCEDALNRNILQNIIYLLFINYFMPF